MAIGTRGLASTTMILVALLLLLILPNTITTAVVPSIDATPLVEKRDSIHPH
jgi:hypothetical protein